MKCCRVQVYLAGGRKAEGETIRVGMTYHLRTEARGLAGRDYQWIWPLTAPMGLYPAYRLVRELGGLRWRRFGSLSPDERRVRKLSGRLEREAWLRDWNVRFLDRGPVPLEEYAGGGLAEPGEGIFTRPIAALLRGRNLYGSEIAAGLKELRLAALSNAQLLEAMIPLLVTGRVEMVPANLPEDGICLRCENTRLLPTRCGVCGEPAWYCPECTEMGESISCRPLFRRADRTGPGAEELQTVRPSLNFPLSPYQAELSRRLEGALGAKGGKDWLLWAVCGAGKTETTFGLMAGVLQRGGRVLFTSPRREVVRQMVGRLREAFPGIPAAGLYGGSEGKLAQAALTISTVHQLVRFYRAFDLIVFDEADAYPYKGDVRLHSLLERSRKEGGKLVYLSATPEPELLERARRGELEVLSLPARFHRKGVPVPELRTERLPALPEVGKMSGELVEWIRASVMGDLAQLFIFLPSRQMVDQFGASLQRLYAAEDLADWVEFSHSRDENRTEKVGRFLQGEYPILVTTTIMERGVTVPKGNVLILYADYEEIFDCQSLVQMAGRAGRSVRAPHGKVRFVARRISREMKKAKEWIERMNAEAQERGLLDD